VGFRTIMWVTRFVIDLRPTGMLLLLDFSSA